MLPDKLSRLNPLAKPFEIPARDTDHFPSGQPRLPRPAAFIANDTPRPACGTGSRSDSPKTPIKIPNFDEREPYNSLWNMDVKLKELLGPLWRPAELKTFGAIGDGRYSKRPANDEAPDSRLGQASDGSSPSSQATICAHQETIPLFSPDATSCEIAPSDQKKVPDAGPSAKPNDHDYEISNDHTTQSPAMNPTPAMSGCYHPMYVEDFQAQLNDPVVVDGCSYYPQLLYAQPVHTQLSTPLVVGGCSYYPQSMSSQLIQAEGRNPIVINGCSFYT